MLILGVLPQIDTTRQVLWQVLLLVLILAAGFVIANRLPKKTNP